VLTAIPPGVPPVAADAARDTLGGAVAVAGQLPGESGAALLGVAHDAFMRGFHIAALVGAVVAVIIAGMVAGRLRDVRASESEEELAG
jgi:DHA2 family multidrug resistance protein-like MFS transporter